MHTDEAFLAEVGNKKVFCGAYILSEYFILADRFA